MVKPQLRAFLFFLSCIFKTPQKVSYSTCSSTELCGIYSSHAPRSLTHVFFFFMHSFDFTAHWGRTGRQRPQSWESRPLEYLCQDGSVIRIRGDNTFWFSARIFCSIERRNRVFYTVCYKKNN